MCSFQICLELLWTVVVSSIVLTNLCAHGQALLKHYDPKNLTMVPYEYFIKDLSGPLTGHRLALVAEVWKLLDKDNSGIVDRAECAALYVAHLHPDVLEGIHEVGLMPASLSDAEKLCRGFPCRRTCP